MTYLKRVLISSAPPMAMARAMVLVAGILLMLMLAAILASVVALGSDDNSGDDPGQNTEPKWYLAPNVPGEGDAPEWLNTAKYKTAEDQAKAYIEADKKLAARDQLRGAPEAYEVKLADEVVALARDEEHAKELSQVPDYVTEWAKKYDLPNEGLNELINQFTKTELESLPDPQAEIKQLGATADQRISRVGNYIHNNFGEDEAMLNLAKGITSTAQGIQLFEKLLTQNNNNLANEGDANSDGVGEISDEEL